MRNWKFWLGMAISAACIYWAFRDVDPRQFFQSLTDARLWVAVPIMVWVMAVVYVRAFRWKLLLAHIREIPTFTLWQSASVGFAVNNLLPARIGELARCYALQRVEPVPFASIFATVVVERMWDGLSVLITIVVLFSVFKFPSLETTLGIDQQTLLLTLGLGTAVIFCSFFVLRYRANFLLRISEAIMSRFSERLAKKVLEMEKTFIQGFQGVQGPLGWLALLGLSLFIIVISAFGVWLVDFAFDYEKSITLRDLALIMVAIMAAVSIPASPGYIGTYHILGKKALMIGGFPPDQALAIATFIHLVNYIPQTLVGLWALKRQGLDVKEVRRAQEHADSPITE